MDILVEVLNLLEIVWVLYVVFLGILVIVNGVSG